MIKSPTALVLLICLAIPLCLQGSERQMYRWTDENGVVHFTDQRPPGQDVTVIQIPESGAAPAPQSSVPEPVPEAGTAGAAADEEVLSPAEQRRREMAERRERILAARRENEQVCAEKRAEVERLEPHRRVYFTNENGEVERMDDVVRTDAVAAAKAFIAEYCN